VHIITGISVLTKLVIRNLCVEARLSSSQPPTHPTKNTSMLVETYKWPNYTNDNNKNLETEQIDEKSILRRENC